MNCLAIFDAFGILALQLVGSRRRAFVDTDSTCEEIFNVLNLKISEVKVFVGFEIRCCSTKLKITINRSDQLWDIPCLGSINGKEHDGAQESYPNEEAKDIRTASVFFESI